MQLPKNSLAYTVLAVMTLGLGACSQVPEKQDVTDSSTQQQVVTQKQPIQSTTQSTGGNEQPQTVRYGGRGVGSYSAAGLSGDFAGNAQLIAFIEGMARQGFNRNYLYGVFSQVRDRDDVARLWANQSSDPGTPKGWYAYRDRFVNTANVQRAAQFWQQNAGTLQRAERQYGVPAEYIVGILGVETRWGRIIGKHRVIDALTTSAITNQRRSKFFFDELKYYLIMCQNERMDPLEPKGSFAGAMGYGQFMPSSFHSYAVDFDGDGIRDLWNPTDAIGSVANYFSKHGWVPGASVAVPAQASNGAYANMPDGFKVKYTLGQLASYGITPRYAANPGNSQVHLLALSSVPGGYKEPWIGFKNFYVITRYNHSNYYAMAVTLLGEAARAQVKGR